ncbi:MAG: hypothetical protein K2J44_05580, partial [Ruminococcus sp.]|nr:hypothetical protein [Ruminococcus sp.]
VADDFQEEIQSEFEDVPPMPDWEFNENDIPPEMPDFGGSFAGDIPDFPDVPDAPDVHIPTGRGGR